MAFKSVTQTMKYRKWSLWSRGEVIIGRFVGFKEGEYKGKPTLNFNLELVEEPKMEDYRGNPIEVGDVISMSLPKSLEDVFEGSQMNKVFKLCYMGKKTSKSGDSYHVFDVERDDEYDLDPTDMGL